MTCYTEKLKPRGSELKKVTFRQRMKTCWDIITDYNDSAFGIQSAGFEKIRMDLGATVPFHV